MTTAEKLARRLEQACARGACNARPSNAGQAEEALLISMALGRRPPRDLDLGQGSWLEALRLLASQPEKGEVRKAATRLLGWRGREAHWLWRWKFQLADRQVQFDPRKYGWGWNDRTISWVIPTSFAVIALEKAVEVGAISEREVGERVALGQAMLLDRSCVGGGWNAGNPVVYGVALKPHLDTTAIALVALQTRRHAPAVQSGLAWLIERAQRCSAPYSLAWAVLAMATLDRVMPASRRRLLEVLDSRPPDVATAAVGLLALKAVDGENPFLVMGK